MVTEQIPTLEQCRDTIEHLTFVVVARMFAVPDDQPEPDILPDLEHLAAETTLATRPFLDAAIEAFKAEINIIDTCPAEKAHHLVGIAEKYYIIGRTWDRLQAEINQALSMLGLARAMLDRDPGRIAEACQYMQVVQDTVTGHQWPEPNPLGAPDPDRIPIHTWPQILRDYALGAAAETETPPELPAMLALGVLSTVSQRYADVEIRPGYIEPTNIYMAIALPPATRKSQEFKRATLPLVKWEADQRMAADADKKTAESKLATHRERIKKLRAQAAKAKDDDEATELTDKIAGLERQEPTIPTAPRLFTSDVTTEHLATIMAENNEALGLLSSEGGIIETMAGRYNNNIPNIDLYLKAHAADFVRVDRGSKPPVIMDEPRLTMALAIQPDVLEAISNKPAFKGRGLVGRILYVIPPSMLGSRTGNGHRIRQFDMGRYNDLITFLADTSLTSTKPDKIYLSAQARDVWMAYWQEVEPELAEGGQYAHCTDWFGKAPGAAARIAALFHIAARGSDALRHEVSVEHMSAAVVTTKALGTHALRVYGQMGAIPGADLARVLLNWIQRHGHREFSTRDAHSNHRSRFQTADELDLPLNILVDNGYIRPLASNPGPGRPSKRFQVNPLVLE